MMPPNDDFLDALRGNEGDNRAREDRERLRGSYAEFIKEAWPALKQHEPFIQNWHLDALACHLEAVTRGEIHRLQIWVPPGTMKTGTVTVFWHPWEWTTRPWLRYFTASYEIHLVQRFSLDAQTVVKSPWYQARWPEACNFTLDAASYWKNTQGGSRFATTPKSTGTGEHGHRIIVDDPVPARAADNSADLLVDLRTLLNQANEWYDGTASSRYVDNLEMSPPFRHARVLVMQRLHENDLAAHMLDLGGDDWTILCLPERFEEGHPYAWRGERIHPAVKPYLPPLLQYGDPRAEDELIWPARRDERASRNLEKELGTFRAAGQLQQRPAPREGNLLKRDWWRFYDPRHRGLPDKLPKFSRVVVSVDTPLKDKESSDNVAITAWGVHGADRYLLDIDVGKMNYGKAKRRVTEMSKWTRKTWPRVHTVCLIENAGYGIELVEDLKREIPGVQKISPGPLGDKVSRAEAASDVLESGNCWLPGYGPPWRPVMDEAQTPQDINAFVHEAATFPFALHDDTVDSWSQAMNWIRSKAGAPARARSLVVGRGR